MEGYRLLFFYVSAVTDISAMVEPIGVKLCMMVHIYPGCPFGGTALRDSQIRFWA